MRARFAAAVACAALLATTASARQVYVTLVELSIVVTDRHGRVVRNLGPGDFVVRDNGRPQDVSFAQRVQAPVNVALILDRSESLGDRFPLVVRPATAFVTSVIRERDDRGAVVAFDSKVYLLHPWTSDSAALVDSIHTLGPAGGSSIFDALLKTCRDLFVDVSDTRQNVVVLVTDGEDTTSVATFDDALRMATRARVAVYVLGVRAEGSLNTREQQGRRVLATLAALTGGRLFYPADHDQASLSAVFSTLLDELRNGYNVTYYLDVPPDDTFHRIRVETTDESLRVRAPTGYYARPWRPTP